MEEVVVKETFGQILLEREDASGKKWIELPIEIMLC